MQRERRARGVRLSIIYISREAGPMRPTTPDSVKFSIITYICLKRSLIHIWLLLYLHKVLAELELTERLRALLMLLGTLLVKGRRWSLGKRTLVGVEVHAHR